MLECHQPAARNFGTIQRQRFQSAARQVSLQDQSIVPGAKNDAVETGIHITCAAGAGRVPMLPSDLKLKRCEKGPSPDCVRCSARLSRRRERLARQLCSGVAEADERVFANKYAAAVRLFDFNKIGPAEIASFFFFELLQAAEECVAV